MTPERHARIKEIFLAACALSETCRQAYLDQQCSNDPELRAEVEKLLQHRTAVDDDAGPRRVAVAPGQEVGADAGPVVVAPRSEAPGRPAAPAQPAPRDLPPGTLIGGRYRIVSLLGRGGMGEVYRADDLTLQQPVALKLLPVALARDAGRLARLRREVRVARRVSHPNVCRVHDLGEAGGECFISMEYVDGEDLHSLLKRIGRLPADKGQEIAHQLCAGVAAAHARGVLHCDLKPANVMIDGRGKTVITDFGLAVPLDEIRRTDIRAGTPAYMAPEQLTGRSVTTRSDLYSLGLVLYEVFTGQQAFRAQSAPEYAALKLRSRPSPPSQLVSDLEPDVERVILRCLERDPRDRPASALSALAAMPGSDPLAAALAAGETPAAEWVAEAGRAHPSRHRLAAAGLAAFLLLLLAGGLMSSKAHPAGTNQLTKSPEALAEKARETLAQWAGREMSSAHEAYGFSELHSCPWLQPQSATKSDNGPRFIGNPASSVLFWYWRSPTPLFSPSALDLVFGNPGIGPSDPLPPGSSLLVLDPSGRLVGMTRSMSPVERDQPGDAAFDWASLFRSAGLDMAGFREVASTGLPESPGAACRAWLGGAPDRASGPIRVEASSHGGGPASWAVLADHPASADQAAIQDLARRKELVETTRTLLVTVMALISVPLALRNVRLGRCDTQGSLRLAIFVLVIRLVGWALLAPNFGWTMAGFDLIILAVTGALAEGTLVAISYLALEPIVRRYWPHTLTAWSRLLRGRSRDPLVALGVLLGAALGALWTVLIRLDGWLTPWIGLTPRLPLRPDDFLLPLTSLRHSLAFLCDALPRSGYDALFLLLIMALLRAALRRHGLAYLLGLLLLLPIFVPRGSHAVVSLVVFGAGGAALSLFVLIRFGIVPIMTAFFVNLVLQRFPLSLDMQSWHFDASIVALAVVLFLAGWAFITAREPQAVSEIRPVR